MRNILLKLSFDGTNYHGWQMQSNCETVQETICKSLASITSENVNLIGCSRTDAGVHANEYYCSFKTQSKIDNRGFMFALNNSLPRDISVFECSDVSLDFHARYDCREKEYVYRIYNSEIKDPFRYKYTYQYKYRLDADFLNLQAQQFIGEYDYSAFCSSGSSVNDHIRKVTSAKVERVGDEVIFTVSANGFLYNMVRIMAGTLIDISRGKILPDSIPDIILGKNRDMAGCTAPAQGLFLNKVVY